MRPGIIALLLAAACGSPDPSDPSDPAQFDAAQMMSDLAELANVQPGDQQMDRDFRATGIMLDRIFTSPGLPDSVKGRTYVMEQDPDGDRYVASVRPGAPPDGARFVLYQTPFPLDWENPIPFPFVETGHVDVATELGASSRRITVTAASGERLAVYSVTATTSPDSEIVELSAFRDHGSDRTELALRGTAPIGQNPAAHRTVTLVFPELELRVVSEATQDRDLNIGLAFAVSVEGRGGRFRLDGRSAFNVTTATVTVDGVEYATMARRGGDPNVVTAVGDRVLTADERSLFDQALGLVQGPLTGAQDLIDPIRPLIEPVALIF